MAPPKAKRSRQSREETGVARDESEPTSSRRTRSTRVAAAATGDGPAGTSVSVARPPPETAESSGTRRITRASRARAEADGAPSTSARTRPFCDHTSAATQTEDPVGQQTATASLPPLAGSTSSSRARSFRRSSSLESIVGSFSTPNLSDEDPLADVDVVEVQPRARTFPVRPPSEAIPGRRITREDARNMTRSLETGLRAIAAGRAASAGRPARVVAVADGGEPRAPIDIVGLLDDIANSTNLFDQLIDEARGGEGGGTTAPMVPRTFRFQRDAANGRLALVRGQDEAGAADRIVERTTTSVVDGTGADTAADAAAAHAAAVEAMLGTSGPQPGTVTTVRLDLQIDVVSGVVRGADGANNADIERMLGEIEAARRRGRVHVVSPPIEDAARFRLDQLTAPEVHRIVQHVMQDCEEGMFARRRARNREERLARAAADLSAAAELQELQSTIAPPTAAAGERRSARLSTRAGGTEAASFAVPSPPPPMPPPSDFALPPGFFSTAVEEPLPPVTSVFGRLMAAAAPASIIGAPASSSSSSTASAPPPPSAPADDRSAAVAQQILNGIRTVVLRDLRGVRRERETAAAAPPPVTPPSSSAATPSTTMRQLRPFAEREGAFHMPARRRASASPPTTRPRAPVPPHVHNDQAITADTIRTFFSHVTGNPLRMEMEVTGNIDRRIRVIVDACNTAVTAIDNNENMDNILAVFLRSIVDAVNMEREARTGTGRRRIITFHMRPLTGIPSTTLRTVFSDLLQDGRGEADPSEQRLREQEDAEEADDSTFSSAEWGECRICMADEPSNPMGCKHCRQLVGCNKCCNRWHRAGRRPTSSIIDTLFASFRADRERFDRIDEQRRAGMSLSEVAGYAAPPTLAASAAAAAGAAGAGDAPPARSSITSTLRNSMLAEAWESNCPLCRKTWRSKPQVVPMQRCRPLGEPLDEEDRGDAAMEGAEAV